MTVAQPSSSTRSPRLHRPALPHAVPAPGFPSPPVPMVVRPPAPLNSRPFKTATLTTFRINTCKSVSKQRTLTPFRINTYKKTGEGGTPTLGIHTILPLQSLRSEIGKRRRGGYRDGQNVCRDGGEYARLCAARISTCRASSSVAHVLSFAFRTEFHMARQTRLYASEGTQEKQVSRCPRRQAVPEWHNRRA
jgi:hypothetical protein